MRYEFWEKRLNAIIAAAGRIAFDWGKTDCALFTADAVWCLTQKDPAAAWRGAYADEAGALRIIASHGGLEGLVEAGLRSIGVPILRVQPSFGQRGDPCLFQGGNGPTLGVIEGRTLVARAPQGLHRQAFDSAEIVWAIR